MVGSLLGPCQDFREASAFFGWSANGLQNFAIISVLMDPFPVGKVGECRKFCVPLSA